MTTTEEIVVLGEDFIERRIFVCPQPDAEDSRDWAYARGYKCGWGRGFFVGIVFSGATALCIWLALCW